MRAACPMCGAMLHEKRFGVAMSPLKAKLIDLVRAAGAEGIESAALLERLPIKNSERKQRTLNVHISQINDALEDTKWRIVGYKGTKFFVRKDRKASPKGLKGALTLGRTTQENHQ